MSPAPHKLARCTVLCEPAMSQHFLLSAKARTLSVLQVAAMTDEQAFTQFRHLRWGDGEDVTCPHCGTVHRHYFIKSRNIWKCAGCRETFSVTSGTIFAFHKLPLKTYLVAVAIFTNAVKSLSALQLARDIGVQYKTAFVLAHKIRESLRVHRDESPLTGDIHMDGAYVGGAIRQENQKEDRVDRRLTEHQNPDKRCILVMRQNHTPEEVADGSAGAKRTLTFILKNENQADINKLAPRHIAPGSVISADESVAYDMLHAKFDMRRVNHSQEFRAADGTTNNQAESFFSRFRRMEVGQVHHVSRKYLDTYANEIAYREDTRRESNGNIFLDIVRKCAHALTSRDWCGYWQGNHRQTERLAI